MKLSVVTITFNDSEGLRRTSLSIPDNFVEWIIIDGSTDKDEKRKNKIIAEKYQCRLIQEPDSGRFNAMNKGLSLASNELVCFMNSGDAFANKDVPKKICLSAETHKWIWAVGQTHCINNQGVMLWPWLMPRHNSLRLKLSLRAYSHQATVYRTDEIRKIGGYYEDSIYSDWVLSLRLARISPPFEDANLWCLFLAGGISSQQTITFWKKECVKLRRIYKLYVTGTKFGDFIFQELVAVLLKIDRKSNLLFRPDLK
jgi:glycosyltransferase involved in cell wall biosynthesis